MKAKKRMVGIALALLIGLVLLALCFLPGLFRGGTYYGRGLLTVTFLDVGQAEATLIGTPEGDFILVDAGNQSDAGIVRDELWLAGAERLALAVATHPHEDHIGAMPEVLAERSAEALYLPDFDTSAYFCERLLKTAAEEGIPARFPQTGEVIYERGGVCVTVAYNGAGAEDANNASLMLRVTYGETSLLLVGDAEQPEEMRAIGANALLKADILELGHHGARDASSDAFIEKVSPQIGVISCGRSNDYGHPHGETLAKMAKCGIRLYRTDESGTLRFVSDGTSWELP